MSEQSMSETSSQNQAILQHLQAGGALTHIDALRLFGCARLAARINDLRMRGVQIVTDTVIEGGKRFASYRMGA